MIKIKDEDLVEIIALSDVRRIAYSIEEQMREMITLLNIAQKYMNNRTDVEQLRATIFFLRCKRKEIGRVITKITSLNS
jgi:hypothetical protein